MKFDYPFEECEECRTLDDCPAPDMGGEDERLCLPMIPDVCPKPITVMKATLKRHKYTHKLMKEN